MLHGDILSSTALPSRLLRRTEKLVSRPSSSPLPRRRKQARLESLNGAADSSFSLPAADAPTAPNPLLSEGEVSMRQRKRSTPLAPPAFVHPAKLFEDEESILWRFGMGGRASPVSVPGFTGYFRQHWRDFHVTEICHEKDGPRCLPRTHDYSVPPVASILQTVDESARAPVAVGEAVRPSDGKASIFSSPSDDRMMQICRLESEDSKGSTFYLQCVLHKQHMAHSAAISLLSQTLRIHPRAISVAGMKDFIGDTVQRVRLENVSPASVVSANQQFQRKREKLTLSHFSYEREALLPGDLLGNHFKIVLRGVDAAAAVVKDAVEGLVTYGFPNYFGCQRFSWFGGCQDASFALLMHNPLLFAFRFLNYTTSCRTLRELLQRPLKYPHPIQDQYRRNVVRRLRHLSIEPSDLDVAPFLSCPSISDVYDTNASITNKKSNFVLNALWESYMDLDLQSRRPTAQRLSSYLWNQVLTLRLHHFGGCKVLEGDHCVPSAWRMAASEASDRSFIKSARITASASTASSFSIEDVVHPGFSFQNAELPQNAVGDFYLEVCKKYGLQWSSRHASGGLKDFLDPPRPIIRRPIDLTYEFQEAEQVLTLQFALERGCYANVAVTELMKAVRCVGSESVLTTPGPDALWSSLGKQDTGYVTSLQDVYPGFEDRLGFISDPHDIPVSRDTETRPWEHSGPLFLPKHEDPYVRAVKWGSRHLLRPMERREAEIESTKKRLFEKALHTSVRDEDIASYAGHTVPAGPNARVKKIQQAVAKRIRRYSGAPRVVGSFSRESQSKKRRDSIPEFCKLNRNSWNVTW